MLLGIGTDVLAIGRMRARIDASSFLEATFTQAEIDLSASRADPAAYYAKVLAGKEAVCKCFGLQPEEVGSWQDIEIVDGSAGQPVVRLRGGLAERAAALGARQVHLSLSYDTDYATAVAVLAGEERHDD